MIKLECKGLYISQQHPCKPCTLSFVVRERGVKREREIVCMNKKVLFAQVEEMTRGPIYKLLIMQKILLVV